MPPGGTPTARAAFSRHPRAFVFGIVGMEVPSANFLWAPKRQRSHDQRCVKSTWCARPTRPAKSKVKAAVNKSQNEHPFGRHPFERPSYLCLGLCFSPAVALPLRFAKSLPKRHRRTLGSTVVVDPWGLPKPTKSLSNYVAFAPKVRQHHSHNYV